MKINLVIDPDAWMTTWTGIRFYILDPRPKDVTLEDLAHHLSLLCRFCGACDVFYSVAQHSVLVSQYAERLCVDSRLQPADGGQLALAALLHDSAEAYTGDIISPLKRNLTECAEIEARLLCAIFERFELSHLLPLSPKISVLDKRALATEHRDLKKTTMPPGSVYTNQPPFKEEVKPWSPKRAEVEFLNRFLELSSRGTEANENLQSLPLE